MPSHTQTENLMTVPPLQRIRRLGGVSLGAICLAFALLGLVSAQSEAGTYEVTTTCAGWEASNTNGSRIAVYATPYMGCSIVTARNVNGNFTTPQGTMGSWSFVAPGGAAIRDISVWGQANASSGWQAAVYFDGGPSSGTSVINCPGGAGCPGASRVFNNVYGFAGGAAAVRTLVRCNAANGCPNDVTRGLLELWDARVTIEDYSPPAVSTGGDLASSGWKSGTRQLVIDAADNVGIRQVRALIDGNPVAAADRVCNYTTKVPCPNGADTLSVPLGAVAEGKHALSAHAIDTAGNLGAQDREIYVDNTAPVSPANVTVQGGAGWRSQNAWDVRWTNPTQNFAPIAGARYSLCPPEADSKNPDAAAKAQKACVTGDRSKRDLSEITDLKLPKAGEWTLRLWLVDAAGNTNPDSAVTMPGLGFDPTPPEVAGFTEQDPNDPARVLVRASDDVSPLTGGSVEAQRRGSRVWRPLATELRGDGITAFLDDETLRKGRYRLRATVTNAAGLQQGTDRGTDGNVKTLKLPIRLKSQLQTGRRVGRICRGGGAKRHCRSKLRHKVDVALGRRITLRGRLTVRGKPIKHQPLEVWQRLSVADAAWQRIGTVQTSKWGRFRYKTAKGPARALRFRYPGTAHVRGDNGTVRLRVQADSTLSVSRRRVINGEYVTFSGQLAGGRRPSGGVLVELQVRSRGKWRTFAQPRADSAAGAWTYQYRFETVRAGARFRFRARIRRQAGYPFATGHSRTIGVSVRGL